MKVFIKRGLCLAMLAVASLLAGCEEPRVYGSVGVSSFGGGWGGPRVGTSISIGGRIY